MKVLFIGGTGLISAYEQGLQQTIGAFHH